MIDDVDDEPFCVDLLDSMLRQMYFRLALFGGYGTPATLSWNVESDATGLVLS